ncbi:hypothetical protein HLB10_00055 [Cellulomonas fimi]|nr:hypothetical protein [Cellulomonas fimi]
MLAPLHDHADALLDLAGELNWFTPRRHELVDVEVKLRVPTTDGLTPDRLSDVQTVFASRNVESFALTLDRVEVDAKPRQETAPRDAMWWQGHGLASAVFAGRVPGDDLDAMSWLAAQVLDCTWRVGIRQTTSVEVFTAPADRHRTW